MNTAEQFIPKKGVILDASALLAFLYKEEGHEYVNALLEKTACFTSSVNWSELVQKVRQKRVGQDPSPLDALVEGLRKVYCLKVESITMEDGKWAAEQWRPGTPLSLADRLCLALSHRLRIPAVTADGAWGSSDLIIQIR